MNLGKAHCPVCWGIGRFSSFSKDRFYEVTPYRAPLYTCSKCGCVYQWPMPSREQVATFYPTGYWQESNDESAMQRLQTTYIESMLKWDLMRWFRRLKLAKGSRVIDIGCSRGDWLAKIQDQGYDVLGLEADPRAAKAARHLGIPVDEVTAEIWQPHPEIADVLLAFHLLEHLTRPAPFLKQCHRALKPGGKLLLRVPNIASFQYALTGSRWKGLEMPRHLVMYRPGPLKKFLRDQGFRILKSSTWSLRDGPPCLASSLFPSGEPTWRAIHRQKGGAWRVLAYLVLTWGCLPLELLAALFGRGSMITIIAEKPKE